MSMMAAVLLSALVLAGAPSGDEDYYSIVPRAYLCVRADAPVVVDGIPGERAWKEADWTEPFVDIEGNTKPAPRLLTRVKMLWDDRYFYFAAELEEPHLWATLLQRDTVIFRDNDFEIFIDPDRDNHRYFEFEMNALNTVWDLFLLKPYRDGGQADNSWDIEGLRSAVHLNGTLNNPSDIDSSWTIEVAIPWNAFAARGMSGRPPVPGDRWRVNFSRVEWEHVIHENRYRKTEGLPEKNWVWSPQGVVDMHRPEKWGIVQFAAIRSERLKPEKYQRELMVLHRLYVAEKEYFRARGAWTASIDSLGLKRDALAVDGRIPSITLTESGFLARIPVPRRSERDGSITIREDSLIRYY